MTTPAYLDTGIVHCATCRTIIGHVFQLASQVAVDEPLSDVVRRHSAHDPLTGELSVDWDAIERAGAPLVHEIEAGFPPEVLVTDRDSAGHRGDETHRPLPGPATCRHGHENTVYLGRDGWTARPQH